jgi:7,8-dihydro-6-hydroxymethylpterin dimethyltransferase
MPAENPSLLSHALRRSSVRVADVAWRIAQGINRCLPQAQQPRPSWAPATLLKSSERTFLRLGLPRNVVSLCPRCVLEKRDRILSGKLGTDSFHSGDERIQAQIVEETGRVLMRKICDHHGPFEDVLSENVAFFKRMESLYQGQDFRCSNDAAVHHHGDSTIRFGRGSFLVFDLTNRCNMKCDPCFMDANQLAHVNELTLHEIRSILERALSFKPQREVNILFSGGEPTLSPHFLSAVRCAADLGFKRIHVATNGIRFAQERGFAMQAAEAGLHSVYLQFDGTTEQKNAHRHIGNSIEVKLKAIDNIAEAGMRTTLQVTVINGINNEGVGSIVDFAIRNIDKVNGVLFQPIMFAGRDEQVDEETRYERRYTLSHLVGDLQDQARFDWDPLRDWVPVSVYTAVSRIVDLLRGSDATQGAVSPDAHPDCCISSPLLVDRRTAQVVPLFSFFDAEQFARDATVITDSARGPLLTKVQLALAAARNIRPGELPSSVHAKDVVEIVRQGLSCLDSSRSDWHKVSRKDIKWTWITIQGMWFQDLFNYDSSNAQASATPVATPDGEIDFSAYNGAGWRQIVEHNYHPVSLAAWHHNHGRHKIFAQGKLIPVEVLSAAEPHHNSSEPVGEISL